jgi:hypothetical protein
MLWFEKGQIETKMRFVVLYALVQCSDTFNFLMSSFVNPADSRRVYDVSQLAKKSSTIGGTLKPSNRLQNEKVFNEFIINRDLSDINILVAPQNFHVHKPSVFGEIYDNETQFGEALYEHRLRPMLTNAKVFTPSELRYCPSYNSVQ